MRREAVWSSRLAGDACTLGTLLIAESGRSEADSSAAGALRCLRALELANAIATEEGLGGSELDRAYATLMHDDRGAVSREGALDRLLRDGQELPALARIGYAQARLESLRPYDDGNGRMGRLVALALARRLEVHGAAAWSLSPSLLQRSKDYESAMTVVREGASADAWLDCFLAAVTDAATEATESLSRFVDLREQHRAAVVESLGHAVPRGLRVLDRLLERPLASVSDLREITGTSYVAANQLAARFLDLGILEEVTGYRRNRLFQYGALLRIFDGGLAQAAVAQATRRPVKKPVPDSAVKRPASVRKARKPPLPTRPSQPSTEEEPLADHLL